MISIDIFLDETGVIKSCSAKGHANAGKTGTDIVCAAVSVLIRTLARVLSAKKGINIQSAAVEPGNLWLKIDYTAEGRDFLSACGEFFVTGLRSLTEEYPDKCKINIEYGR